MDSDLPGFLGPNEAPQHPDSRQGPPIRLMVVKRREDAARALALSQDGEVCWPVSVPQYEFARIRTRYVAYTGGVGSGKTIAGALKAIIEGGRRRSVGLLVAPTYPMLHDLLLPAFFKYAIGPGESPRYLRSYNKAEDSGDLINGTKVYCRSADKPDKLRGFSAGWIWADEVREWGTGDPEAGLYTWNILVARLRQFKDGVLFLTTTPCGRSHWLAKKFLDSNDPDFAIVKSATQDNPFLPDDFAARLAHEYGTGFFYKQEAGGEFVDPEGDLFQKEWFVIKEPPQNWRYFVRGWDLAYSTKTKADYTCGVKLGVTATNDVWVLNVVHGKWPWPQARQMVADVARGDGSSVIQAVEKVGAQLGSLQDIRDVLVGHPIKSIDRLTDKTSYALPIASRLQQGKMFIAPGAWNQAYIEEFLSFDGEGRGHDDYVDATANAMQAVVRPRIEITEW